MVGRIKMKRGTEVGLGPDHIVLDRDPVPQKRHTAAPICSLCLVWIKMPLGTEVQGLGPGNIVLDEDLAPQTGTQLPNFRLMSVVAKRLGGSRCQFVRR